MKGSWEEVIKEKRERIWLEGNLEDKVDSKIWRKRRNVIEETKVGESLCTCKWQAALWSSVWGILLSIALLWRLCWPFSLPACVWGRSLQNCRRDTRACQGCSAGVAVIGRHTLLTGPASPPKWYFPNCVRTATCRNQNADSRIPPPMFWFGVGSKNLQVVWCFDVLRSMFKESLCFSWQTVETVTPASVGAPCPVDDGVSTC